MISLATLADGVVAVADAELVRAADAA